jgi:hypothetical protein
MWRERATISPPVLGRLHYARYSSIRGYGVRCAERTLAFGGSSLLDPDASGVRNADMNSGSVESRFFANYRR